jgi:peptidoglycan hydrolase-like amidase
MEDYIRYVLPSEMPLSFSYEALKAQAVCARTFTYGQMKNDTYARYGANLDDSIAYQAYHATTSYEVTVKKNTEVSVQLVPASYKVTYKVNNEQGKLLVGKDTEEKTDGEISAAYGTSIKFTAVSNKFCHIKGWKLDGTEVTDTTEERRLPIQIRSVRRERYTDIL